MAHIVSGVLKYTFGFLANKIPKEVAERLKDSDVTDEECRRLIVRELDDLKSNLDSLARQYLLSSLCFLQEGVNRLYESLLHFPSDANTAESTEGATVVEASLCAATGPISPIPVNEAVALTIAMTSLKIHSNERFKSAIESFKLAREKATEAFCNEALSIEDRIQASQIRMTRILENLEDPDASVSDCLQYLQQLHDVRAIREIFSVLIDGGMKSCFNQTKRLKNASSVLMMNQTLFDFARKFAEMNSTQAIMFRWPMILLGKKVYNPVFGEEKLVRKLEESGLQVMSPSPAYLRFKFGDRINPDYSAVNSKGEIVAKIQKEEIIKIFKRSFERRAVCKVPMREELAAMDIDAKDNMFFITVFRENCDQYWSFKLFIFDENGNKKLETPLSFLRSYHGHPKVLMAINKEGRIAVLGCELNDLHIGNVCVERNSYEVDKSTMLGKLNVLPFNYFHMQISDLNGSKIFLSGHSKVYIFTEDGLSQRKIEIPSEHGYIKGVAINHVTKRILVQTYRGNCSSLLSFSESGELLHSLDLWSDDTMKYTRVVSHPSGLVALVGYRRAFLLQQ